ncbi:MAG TPA: DUF72 domain-containing protein [Bacteroidia bacterium]
MDFGKLPSVDDISFSLPADHPGVKKVLGGAKNNIRIYTGAPVWTDKGFVGMIYPEGTKEKDFLYHYSRQFSCIELNSTHYAIPSPETIRKWKETVPPGFKFCPKVPQTISHAKRIDQCINEMNYFIETINGFEDNLGASFLQLPPVFSAREIKNLMYFLDKIDPIHLSIELRHPNWFVHTEQLKELCNFLYQKKMGLVITDVAGRRDVLHMRLTNKTAMIRFGANNLHASDSPRIDEWVERICLWIANGLEELYFLMHTPKKYLTAPLAVDFINKLNPHLTTKLPNLILQDNIF